MGRQRAKKRAQAEASRKGAAKNYITRTQAVRKLQLSLPDFRKLCIWKGIYPREPRSKKRVSKSATPSTTFYYSRDIQYLLHEPLVAKFRDLKSLEKKISRALGRGDVSDAQRLEQNASRPEKTGKPRYTLDHVIRERYPTFLDALRDLDDCLSMLFLFANLPSSSSVPAKMIARCERLCLEFQHYLIVSHSLQKSFLSIKGIYYEANVQGESILWVVPYKFNQRVVGDVDFRIMGTFIEFYMTLLGFVNLRLYTSVGLKYPPRFDQNKDDQGAELAALTLEGTEHGVPSLEGANPLTNGEESKLATQLAETHVPDPQVQVEVDKVIQELKGAKANGGDAAVEVQTGGEDDIGATETFDKFEPAAPGGDVLPQPSYSTNDPGALFANCTFFLSRETPRQPLEFILKAFGCKRVGWDAVLGDGAFTTNERDPRITHQVVDRPVVRPAVSQEGDGEDNQTSLKLGPNQRVLGRIYVQPQWVWDSINDEELKQAHEYAPGAQLPPHFSPFVKSVGGGYDPTIPLEDQETEAEALAADSDDEMEAGGVQGDDADAVGIDDAMDIASDDEVDESGDAGDGTASGSISEQDAGSEDDEESATLQRQRELEAELGGKVVRNEETRPRDKAKNAARKALAKRRRGEEEDLERARGMLPKKKRVLYEQMIYSNKKRSAEDEKLRAKRRKIERGLAKGKAQ